MEGFFRHRPDATQRALSQQKSAAFGPATAHEVRSLLAQCPRYVPTPLLSLDAIAAELGVARVQAKDERARLGVGSFKGLGGVHAVLRLAARAASAKEASEVTFPRLLSGKCRLDPGWTVTTATAGNHGRSVAAGAALVNARCRVFVYDGVPDDQIAAIERHGAQIERVTGNYETAVTACRERAEREGWHVVSDTSWEGYEETPTWVMAGYTAMPAEALEQAAPAIPTHVVLQAGVGGMAGAVAGYLAQRALPHPPKLVVVEALATPCLLESARQGRPITVEAGPRTVMGRLECCRPSPVAWSVLAGSIDAFIAVDDVEALSAQRRLAECRVETSPSGAAGLAGLVRIANDPRARTALALDAHSRVLLFVTEEATVADRSRISAMRSE